MSLIPDFASIKKLLRNASDEKRALDERIAEKQRERVAVENAPIARADLIEHLKRHVASVADGYRANFQAVIAPIVRQPRILGIHGQFEQSIKSLTPFGATGDGRDTDGVLCALFGDQLVAAMVATVERMEWPAGALTSAERAAKLARLDEQLDKLISDRNEIKRRADEAGVSLD